MQTAEPFPLMEAFCHRFVAIGNEAAEKENIVPKLSPISEP